MAKSTPVVRRGANTHRIVQLRSLISKAKQAYYFGGAAIMSDDEYDALENELGRLSPGDPLLATVGAPMSADSMLSKAEHRIPMGSQAKVNTEEELRTWYCKALPTGEGLVHASLKGDGASAAAYYAAGELKQVISRGDGRIGEDITANAMKFQGLPVHVIDEFSGAVRFEVILTLQDWGTVDPTRSKNPRNAGSGIMGRKSGHQSELLTIFAFDIDEQTAGVPPLESEQAKSDRLLALGFQSMPHRLCRTADEVVTYFQEVSVGRSTLPFWIDGVVLKVDNSSHQKSLGETAGRPKGQVAWKFVAEGAESVLLRYSVTGGHTGTLVPNAHFEPVEIGGTTVSNALLNNWEEIERLGVAVGDRIWVVKANDIIPKIIEVRGRPRNRQPIPEPTHCPFCGADVGRRKNTSGESGALTVCRNSECPKKSEGKIRRWIKSVGIDGIGDAVRLAMVEQMDLRDAGHLYLLRDRFDELSHLVINNERDLRLGEKRAQTIVDSVESSRRLSLLTFLGSLGVNHLGTRRVELMVRSAAGGLSTLEDWRAGKLRDADFAELVGVPNLGHAFADGIDALAETIDSLLAAGVEVLPPQLNDDTLAAGQVTVCISGKLPSGKKKKEYADPLTEAGMRLVVKVGKGLGYLVLADPGSKSAKAQKARGLGVELIDESQLQALLAAAKGA